MGIVKSILFAVISLVFFSTAHAEVNASADCIAQSEMKVIASHFNQFANLTNADFCNDNSQNWHLLSSIMFMRKTQFSQTMPPSKDELFTGRFAKSWYDYFIGRINNLEVVSSCPKGVIAYVYMFGDKTMYTCPAALTNSFSSLDRASVMMHEARHIDGFPHITCSKGARQGLQGACDKKIADELNKSSLVWVEEDHYRLEGRQNGVLEIYTPYGAINLPEAGLPQDVKSIQIFTE